MTVWSASTFNNELDVLEIRLETLDPLVDRFVLAEATVTQRNQPKPLYFAENKARFARFLPKITHIVVDDMPGGEGYDADWGRERFQRNALGRVLHGQVDPSDRVLISDLDEIPYPDALVEACVALETYPVPVKFLMDMFVYRLNWRWLDRACLIGSTAAVFKGNMIDGVPIHDVLLKTPLINTTPGVAGWHLAYQGDVEMLRRKMTCIADNFYEQLVPDHMKGDRNLFLTDEWIQGSIDTGRDIYARDYRPSEWVGLEAMPPCVQENPAKYAHMMVPKPDSKPDGWIPCNCGGFYQDEILRHFPKCEMYEEQGVPA
jgi:glycosyl transferase family 17